MLTRAIWAVDRPLSASHRLSQALLPSNRDDIAEYGASAAPRANELPSARPRRSRTCLTGCLSQARRANAHGNRRREMPPFSVVILHRPNCDGERPVNPVWRGAVSRRKFRL